MYSFPPIAAVLLTPHGGDYVTAQLLVPLRDPRSLPFRAFGTTPANRPARRGSVGPCHNRRSLRYSKRLHGSRRSRRQLQRPARTSCGVVRVKTGPLSALRLRSVRPLFDPARLCHRQRQVAALPGDGQRRRPVLGLALDRSGVVGGGQHHLEQSTLARLSKRPDRWTDPGSGKLAGVGCRPHRRELDQSGPAELRYRAGWRSNDHRRSSL